MKKQHILSIIYNFLLCGLLGWCFECFWTGMNSLFEKDRKLTCHSSLWMFPIYGLACIFKPLHRFFSKSSMFLRGTIYTVLVFCIEFTSGLLLKAKNACPWDYSKAKTNIKGVIRLDYAPAWFIMGLIYDTILDHLPKNK